MRNVSTRLDILGKSLKCRESFRYKSGQNKTSCDGRPRIRNLSVESETLKNARKRLNREASGNFVSTRRGGGTSSSKSRNTVSFRITSTY